jgi:hypothetical protein
MKPVTAKPIRPVSQPIGLARRKLLDQLNRDPNEIDRICGEPFSDEAVDKIRNWIDSGEYAVHAAAVHAHDPDMSPDMSID